MSTTMSMFMSCRRLHAIGWLTAALGLLSCSDDSITCGADQVSCAGACQPASTPCVEPDVTLRSLVPAVGELSPAFSPSTLEYTLSVPSWLSRVALTPTLERPGASIQVGPFPTPSGVEAVPTTVAPGTTPIPVTVTAESGLSRTYRVLAQVSQPTQHYLKPSPTIANARFGTALAIDGDTLVVSARHEDAGTEPALVDIGAVYVFRFDGRAWVQEARILPGPRFNGYGASVAVQGDLLAIGAPWRSGVGVVEIYERSGGTWQYRDSVWPPVSFGRDSFGMRLALAGDTLAVSMPNNPGGASGVNSDFGNTDKPGSGAVYVFRRQGNTWQHEAFVKALDPDIDDQFGCSLALSGDDLVVGACREASAGRGAQASPLDNSAPASGAAYVYSRVGSSWTVRAYLKASNAQAGDRFGCSVAMGANTLAVGACGEDSQAAGIGGDESDDSQADSGAVYVFARSGAAWTQQAYIKAGYPGAGDQFGYSLSMSADGQVLAVGAATEAHLGVGINPQPYDRSAWDSGAAYVFRRARGRWRQEAYLKAPNAGIGDRFGETVLLAPDGRSLLIGAIGEASQATGSNGDDADNSRFASGAAYLYR